MNKFALYSAATAASLAVGTAQAALVMTIDLTDPTAVVFEATGANASAAYTSITDFQGITMVGMLPGNTTLESIPMDLPGIALNSSDGNSLVTVDDMYVDFYPGGWTPEYFNIYQDFGTTPVATFTDKPVAYGFAVHDLSALTLPSVGHTGNVVVGEAGAELIVGTYEVVPEPKSLLMMITGAGVLARRRRANA